MHFYEMMQMGANQLKPLIQQCEDARERRNYKIAFATKNILCILFCMLIVTGFTKWLGPNNSIVGVVAVITLLTFRFSNFDFKVGQSAWAILGIYVIYMIAPYLASQVHPLLGFLIHILALLSIVIVSCHNTHLSNQSTLVLCYLLLYGYEAQTPEDFIKRLMGLMVSGCVVASVFYFKQRKKVFEYSIRDILKSINFKTPRTKWQLKLALGIASVILIGEVLNVPRVMWIACGCLSLLQPNEEKTKERIRERYIYVIIGCFMFLSLYITTPENLRGYIGMLGGLMVGFSATYKWQTVFNSFGALVVAVPLFGLEGALIIRILDNILAAGYSKVFNAFYNKILDTISQQNLVLNTSCNIEQ